MLPEPDSTKPGTRLHGIILSIVDILVRVWSLVPLYAFGHRNLCSLSFAKSVLAIFHQEVVECLMQHVLHSSVLIDC